ncbi:MAG: MFS transporter [Acidimicrobiia bacterium]|nr:MFS transporter [Acidimicrobiia bacterium]
MAVSTSSSTARQFIPYFVVTGALSLGYGSVFTLLAEIEDEYGVSGVEIGLIAGAGLYAGVIAQVGLARFADKGHIRLLVHAGIIVAMVSMLGMATANNAWQFIVARFFLGAGIGMVAPAVRRILITRDPSNMGKNLGAMSAFDISGFVLGPLVAALFAHFFNLHAPFWFLAALYALVYGWVLRLDMSAGATSHTKVPVFRLLGIRPMLAGILAGIAFFTTIGVFEASWALLIDDLGGSTIIIGLSISLFAVPMIPLAPFGGKLAQRVGPMRVMPYSIMGAVACMFVYGYVEFMWVLIAISAFHAMFDAFTLPAGQLAVAISAPTDQAAAAQGLYGAMGLTVAGSAALATGPVYEAWGAEVLFTGSSIIMVVALAGAIALGGELMGPASRPASEPAPASS